MKIADVLCETAQEIMSVGLFTACEVRFMAFFFFFFFSLDVRWLWIEVVILFLLVPSFSVRFTISVRTVAI